MQKLILIHSLDLNRSGAGKGIWGNIKDVRNSMKTLQGEMESLTSSFR